MITFIAALCASQLLNAQRSPGSYLNAALEFSGGTSTRISSSLEYGTPLAGGSATARLIASLTPHSRSRILPQFAWDRRIFGGDVRVSVAPSTTQPGRFEITAQQTRTISSNFNAVTQMFGNGALGISGMLNVGTNQSLGFALAPHASNAMMQFFNYRYDDRRLGAQVGALPGRDVSLSYQLVGGKAPLTITLYDRSANGFATRGITSYVMFPLGNATTLSISRDISTDGASQVVSLQHSQFAGQRGSGYAVSLTQGTSQGIDASFYMQTPKLTTQVHLSDFGGQFAWQAGVSRRYAFPKTSRSRCE